MKKAFAEFILVRYLKEDIKSCEKLACSPNITEEQRNVMIVVIDTLRERVDDISKNGISD